MPLKFVGQSLVLRMRWLRVGWRFLLGKPGFVLFWGDPWDLREGFSVKRRSRTTAAGDGGSIPTNTVGRGARLPSRGCFRIVDRRCPYPHLSRSPPGFNSAAPSLRACVVCSRCDVVEGGKCPRTAHAPPRLATRRGPGSPELLGRFKVNYSNSHDFAIPKTP